MPKILSEAFKDWLDFDSAEFELAKCLGLMPDVAWDPVAHKYLFWTSNLFGNTLYQILEKLVDMGALEIDGEDHTRFRWNPDFNYTTTADIEH